MQKIVLFIEPSDDAWKTPFKIAELVMNRFYFEAEASFKIVKIFELEKSSVKLSHETSGDGTKRCRPQEWKEWEEKRNKKGMSLSTGIYFYTCGFRKNPKTGNIKERHETKIYR